jgi:hypothetical protein
MKPEYSVYKGRYIPGEFNNACEQFPKSIQPTAKNRSIPAIFRLAGISCIGKVIAIKAELKKNDIIPITLMIRFVVIYASADTST